MHDHATAGTVLQARSPAGCFVLDWTQPVALRPAAGQIFPGGPQTAAVPIQTPMTLKEARP